MLRGTRFLAMAIIVVFIASAFFSPSFGTSNSGNAGSAGSIAHAMGNVSNIGSPPSFGPASDLAALFNETGLPSGTSWSVHIYGETFSSTNSSIEITLPAGSYNYTVSNALDYFTLSPSGTLNFKAAGQVVTTSYLGKYQINQYLNLESGNISTNSGSLSTSQSVFPIYGAFDNFSHTFLVVGYSSSEIYRVSPVNYSITGEISVPDSPLAVAVNPANGVIYVINNTALLKYSSSGSLMDSSALPSMPAALAFDPANGQVLVSGTYGGVYAFNGSDLSIAATLPSISQFDLQGFAYNSALGQMEILNNSGSNGYIAFMGSNDSIVSSIMVPGYAISLVYDPAQNISLFSSIASNIPYAYVVAGSSLERIAGSANAYGLGFNSGTGMGIATNMQNSTIMLINLTTGHVVYTVSTGGSPLMPLTAPGSPGMLVVDPNYDAVDIVPLAYSVRGVEFVEQGISPLQQWGITVNGYTMDSASSSLLFSEPSGNFTYMPLQVSGYSTWKTGSFTVSDSNVVVSVVYNRTYDVQFIESGLPPGNDWTVTLNGSSQTVASGTPAVFPAVNGTYSFNVSGAQGYAVSPQNGIIAVSGSAVSVNLNFSMVSHLVNFSSTGLPGSAHWYLTINGVQHLAGNGTFSYTATPGNYNYSIKPIAGYYPQTASGSFSVSDHNITVNVTWLPFLYRVDFNQNSLPNGTSWTVTLSNGVTLNSTTSAASAFLQNGTYSYAYSSLNTSWKGFHGTFSVQGSQNSVFLNFTEVLFSVSFMENGLPFGTDWTVSFNGLTQGTTGNHTSFMATNGTYSYSAAPANSSFIGAHGFLTVNGTSVSQGIQFTLKLKNVTFHESGLPAGSLWGVHLLSGKDYSTNGSNINLTLPTGTYSYIPLPVSGYNASGISTSFYLAPDSPNLTINVTYNALPVFSTQKYNVTVMEIGLPEGLEWAVSYNGTTVPAFPGGIFKFSLPNGSYNFTFMALSHDGNKMPGSFTANLVVNGTAQDLLVLFYGPFVWMVFDFPIIGNSHADHHDSHNHQHDNHNQHNVALEVRVGKRFF